MHYNLRRSARRRTIGITVRQGEVRVAAPYGVAEQHIDAFVASKKAWINRHLQAQSDRLTALPQRQWQHGESVYWLGQPCELNIRPGQRNTIEAIGNSLHIRLSRRQQENPAQVRQLVRQWFSEQGQQWLDSYVPACEAYQALPATQWRIANYTAKWGACNRRGELSFSWRLFAAPEWVVRYVVLHELCHIRHFDHSANFWQLVSDYDPAYMNAERWLKAHGHTLLNDNCFSFVNDLLDAGQNPR